MFRSLAFTLCLSASVSAATIQLGPIADTSNSTTATSPITFLLVKDGFSPLIFDYTVSVADVGIPRIIDETTSLGDFWSWPQFVNSFQTVGSDTEFGIGPLVTTGDPLNWSTPPTAPGFVPSDIQITLTNWDVFQSEIYKRAEIVINGTGSPAIPEPATVTLLLLAAFFGARCPRRTQGVTE